jgi:hypothetical protein
MFEKVVLRRSSTGPAITVGEVAEALLFYQNVHIVLDYPGLGSLLDGFGARGLLALLARPNVTAVYTEETLGTFTETIGFRQLHNFVAFKVSGEKDRAPVHTRKGRLAELIARKGHPPKEALRLAERLRERLPIRPFSGDTFVRGGVAPAAMADLLDADYVSKAMRHVAMSTPGLMEFSDSLRFEVVPSTPGKVEVLTNLDFDAVNSRRNVLSPNLGSITPASLLMNLLDARADTALAAHYGGDFRTSDATSEIVRVRFSELLKRSGISAAELSELHETVLPDYPTIKEVVDAGERTFDEFLLLLEKAERFRSWVSKVSPDEKLVGEYIRAISAEGWTSTLPAKVVRFMISTGLGFAAPIAGVVVSAADSLLLDKIAGGWRPSHWVDGTLKEFLAPGRE